MPPFIHEALKEFVSHEPQDEMDRIADEYPDLADTRRKIFRLSRTPVRKHEPRFNLSPDSQLRSEGGFRSHFFIEVGPQFLAGLRAPSTRRTEG
ncbi:hypothetical protein EKO27_g12030, partial [Xylaria grammica]